jgi:hypothetical protein
MVLLHLRLILGLLTTDRWYGFDIFLKIKILNAV